MAKLSIYLDSQITKQKKNGAFLMIELKNINIYNNRKKQTWIHRAWRVFSITIGTFDNHFVDMRIIKKQS